MRPHLVARGMVLCNAGGVKQKVLKHSSQWKLAQKMIFKESLCFSYSIFLMMGLLLQPKAYGLPECGPLQVFAVS